MRERIFAGAMLACALSAAGAAPLLTVGTSFPNGYPTDQSVHGWQFSTNQPITVTHLGLFDDFGDGFDISYQVGLFRLADQSLMVSGVIGSGVANPLLDQFRYVDVPDTELSVGERYVLSFFTSDPAGVNRDNMITPQQWPVSVDPVITYEFARWGTASSLSIPQNRILLDRRIGPNALFVPIPAAVWLLGSALGVLGVMRRRASRT